MRTAFSRTGRDCGRRLREPILILRGVSRDGQWIVGWAPLPGGEGAAFQAFSLRRAAIRLDCQQHRLELVAAWRLVLHFRRARCRGPQLHHSAAARSGIASSATRGICVRSRKSPTSRRPQNRRVEAVPGPSPGRLRVLSWHDPTKSLPHPRAIGHGAPAFAQRHAETSTLKAQDDSRVTECGGAGPQRHELESELLLGRRRTGTGRADRMSR